MSVISPFRSTISQLESSRKVAPLLRSTISGYLPRAASSTGAGRLDLTGPTVRKPLKYMHSTGTLVTPSA